jgi:orotidine-5'-phosphate decarboxylase
VLYASSGDDFASAARRVAQATRLELNAHRPAA